MMDYEFKWYHSPFKMLSPYNEMGDTDLRHIDVVEFLKRVHNEESLIFYF